MPKFKPILDRALQQHGEAALTVRLPQPVGRTTIRDIPDDRWLAEMTRRIFQAGFVWRIIDHKWPGFEAAFGGFDPAWLCIQPEEFYEDRMADTRIIRNWQKIEAVMFNAEFVYRVSEQYEGFGNLIADWPGEDIVGLWLLLKKEGKRLGGNTGPYLLRRMGKDTFLLTEDVVRALIMANVVDKRPGGKRDLQRVQDAFNDWSQETGRPMGELSMILACSVG